MAQSLLSWNTQNRRPGALPDGCPVTSPFLPRGKGHAAAFPSFLQICRFFLSTYYLWGMFLGLLRIFSEDTEKWDLFSLKELTNLIGGWGSRSIQDRYLNYSISRQNMGLFLLSNVLKNKTKQKLNRKCYFNKMNLKWKCTWYKKCCHIAIKLQIIFSAIKKKIPRLPHSFPRDFREIMMLLCNV